MAKSLKEATRLYNQSFWVPESTILKPEATLDRADWAGTCVELRVAQCFSFWYKGKCIGFDPSKAKSADLKDVTMCATVASLNGPARYLVQAGELYFDWPLRHYESMKISNIQEVRIDRHQMFRCGQPAVCVITGTHQYFLLQPDIFYEKDHWNSDVKAWESSQKYRLTLTFPDVSHQDPREGWWKGLKSWLAWKEAERVRNGEKGSPDPHPDKPRPDDEVDDDQSDHNEETEAPHSAEAASGAGSKHKNGGIGTAESNGGSKQKGKGKGKGKEVIDAESVQEKDESRISRSSRLRGTTLGKRPLATGSTEPTGRQRRARMRQPRTSDVVRPVGEDTLPTASSSHGPSSLPGDLLHAKTAPSSRQTPRFTRSQKPRHTPAPSDSFPMEQPGPAPEVSLLDNPHSRLTHVPEETSVGPGNVLEGAPCSVGEEAPCPNQESQVLAVAHLLSLPAPSGSSLSQGVPAWGPASGDSNENSLGLQGLGPFYTQNTFIDGQNVDFEGQGIDFDGQDIGFDGQGIDFDALHDLIQAGGDLGDLPTTTDSTDRLDWWYAPDTMLFPPGLVPQSLDIAPMPQENPDVTSFFGSSRDNGHSHQYS